MNALELGQSLKILLVEDNPAEAELVQEFLSQGSPSQFDLTHVKSLSQSLKCLVQSEFDIILLDLSLPDSQGLETVIQVKVKAPTAPIVVLTALNNRTTAIEAVRQGVQDYLVKGQFDGELLIRAMRYAIERQRDREAIRQQAERERLLERMIEHIRQFLDLGDILQTTVAEVRHFLKTDRVLLYRCLPRQTGCLVLESADYGDGCPGMDELDTGLTLPWYPSCEYLQAIDDVNTSELEPNYIDQLNNLQARAILSVPILPREQLLKTPNSLTPNPLWGILIAHHCHQPRQWQPWEINCLKQLVNQVAIAIQQSELYQQLELANQQLQQLATIDSLTQIANRRRFDEVLKNEWRRLAREFKPLSLILGDIDFFKVYNDTYGHLGGDACLQKIAKTIRQAAKRSTDLVARYGGEEFAVILPGTDAMGAFVVAVEMHRKVEGLQLPHPNSPIKPWVTLSIGIATTTPSLRQSPTHLIEVADCALYQAKALGRDRIFHAHYDPHPYPSIS